MELFEWAIILALVFAGPLLIEFLRDFFSAKYENSDQTCPHCGKKFSMRVKTEQNKKL